MRRKILTLVRQQTKIPDSIPSLTIFIKITAELDRHKVGLKKSTAARYILTIGII